MCVFVSLLLACKYTETYVGRLGGSREPFYLLKREKKKKNPEISEYHVSYVVTTHLRDFLPINWSIPRGFLLRFSLIVWLPNANFMYQNVILIILKCQHVLFIVFKCFVEDR